MSNNIKVSGVVLEQNGVRHSIETVEDFQNLVLFGQEYISRLAGVAEVKFGSSSRLPHPNLPDIKHGDIITDPFSGNPLKVVYPSAEDGHIHPVKREIQRMLDSGSNKPKNGTPVPGERGVDYFVEAFVQLKALKGTNKYVTFPEICLNMLQQGMTIGSSTADKAIGSVRSMVRGKEVEKLIDKRGDRMCLTRLPVSEGRSTKKQEPEDSGIFADSESGEEQTSLDVPGTAPTQSEAEQNNEY